MSTYQRAAVTGDGLRLHLNENTAGCSPAVLRALAALTPDQIASYPDYTSAIEATASWFGVPRDWVLLVNGLDEGLHLAAAAASAERGFTGVVLEPAFEMYAACIEESGGAVVRVPPRDNFEFSLTDVLAASETARLVYLTDPNNPTGLGLPAGAIEAIAAARSDATIVVDEAYADFSGRSFIGTLRDDRAGRYRNVIVGRTFAKGHGLAALRIGALIARPETLAPLATLQAPYSLNIAATVALEAALSDPPWLASCVAEAGASKQAVYEFCGRHGIAFWPSEANFVLINAGARATELVAYLAARGIFVRDRSTAPGCAGAVRITTGLVAHTARCLRAMEAFYAPRHD